MHFDNISSYSDNLIFLYSAQVPSMMIDMILPAIKLLSLILPSHRSWAL